MTSSHQVRHLVNAEWPQEDKTCFMTRKVEVEFMSEQEMCWGGNDSASMCWQAIRALVQTHRIIDHSSVTSLGFNYTTKATRSSQFANMLKAWRIGYLLSIVSQHRSPQWWSNIIDSKLKAWVWHLVVIRVVTLRKSETTTKCWNCNENWCSPNYCQFIPDTGAARHQAVCVYFMLEVCVFEKLVMCLK